nr:immunoglobulin light chain junction region [Macaca mulatta]MOV92189.1 immunoglobulin light chain junction region [Macaca mulatta]MOV92209.1 immunoglobulin light chain junction region [Macaca mulatta]MOV92231.1 immunoglobulin light chain junction region [Macaca mulatta]MOV92253.1 immunoglobulin light chain junction region [Macaca mulatta]
CLQHKNYPPTF